MQVATNFLYNGIATNFGCESVSGGTAVATFTRFVLLAINFLCIATEEFKYLAIS